MFQACNLGPASSDRPPRPKVARKPKPGYFTRVGQGRSWRPGRPRAGRNGKPRNRAIPQPSASPYQARIGPALAVDLWSLDTVGQARVAALCEAIRCGQTVLGQTVLGQTGLVISSAETKALQTATPLTETLGARLDLGCHAEGPPSPARE